MTKFNARLIETDTQFVSEHIRGYLKDPYFIKKGLLLLSEPDFKNLPEFLRFYFWIDREGETRILSLRVKVYKTREEYVLYKIIGR